MFKNLFKEKSASKVIETHEADVVLRLMFEIAISDGCLDKAELEMIKKRASKSGDNDEKVSKIIKRIIDETEDSVSFYPSVKEINDTHSLEEKKELLSVLWNLVKADSVVDAYEENLYFKIAELIKIKRSVANQIKQKNS
ncbi:TerB family tellurite resistance protein [Gammaproteobacteria bacterium]|nr:TerB family tellurite resistance protein [Gammaproteobacteria bacterium]